MRFLVTALLIAASTVPSVMAEEVAAPAKAPEVATVGKPAPDFTVPGLTIDQEEVVANIDREKPFRLSAHKGERPVLIIFSSFT